MQLPTGRTADEHRCAACEAVFEVSFEDGLDRTSTESLEVRCPRCGKPHIVPVPCGARGSIRVEPAVGPEPDVGGGAGGD
jgi:DNA-directed RNA polymerase subunit RPC12/RpoP